MQIRRKLHNPFGIENLTSAEGLADPNSTCLSEFIHENPERFFKALRILQPEHQEMVLEYYLLRKPQVWLARIHGKTQTLVWQELQRFSRVIAAGLLFGPHPTEVAIRQVLTEAGLERIAFKFRPVSVASLAERLVRYNNVRQAAFASSLPMPLLRKSIQYAGSRLSGHDSLKHQAMGEYLKYIAFYRMHSYRSSVARRSREKAKILRRLRFEDPKIFGEFEVDVTRPEFSALCPSLAAVS